MDWPTVIRPVLTVYLFICHIQIHPLHEDKRLIHKELHTFKLKEQLKVYIINHSTEVKIQDWECCVCFDLVLDYVWELIPEVRPINFTWRSDVCYVLLPASVTVCLSITGSTAILLRVSNALINRNRNKVQFVWRNAVVEFLISQIGFTEQNTGLSIKDNNTFSQLNHSKVKIF